MEIRWLEDFLALARTRHFSRAADEQNITQPTFSRRIKMLEEEMGGDVGGSGDVTSIPDTGG